MAEEKFILLKASSLMSKVLEFMSTELILAVPDPPTSRTAFKVTAVWE